MESRKGKFKQERTAVYVAKPIAYSELHRIEAGLKHIFAKGGGNHAQLLWHCRMRIQIPKPEAANPKLVITACTSKAPKPEVANPKLGIWRPMLTYDR